MVGKMVCLVSGITVLLASAGPLSGQEAALDWSEGLDRGEVLEVKSIVGDVRVTLASGRIARVVATKHGRRSDFAEVDVRVVRERDGYTICVVYDWQRSDRDECDHRGRNNRNGNHSIDVGVDFEVQVPAGVEFIGSTVTGDVEVEDVRSDVSASSVSGNVYVSTTEVAHGNTVSGDIEIEMGSTDWRDLDFNTVSGDITLSFPAELDADVEFESLSGDFDSDFDLNVTRRRDRFIGSSIRATIGDGGRHLSFRTVSGDVRLRRNRRTPPA